MWIAIIAVSVAILALAAYAATGRMGEMPADPVLDDHPGHVPDGPVDAEFLAAVKFPVRAQGYSPEEVDRYLDGAVSGSAVPPDEVRFRVCRSGYDMAVVDRILDRLSAEQRAAGAGHGAGVDLDSIFRQPEPGQGGTEAADEAVGGR